MADLRTYNRQFATEFIELYKSLPALWKIKSKDYSDRNKKNDAYEQMIIKLKEVEPEATKDTVKKKNNSLRTCYRKEMKKVNASTRSGAATDDIYEPTLWYFHLLDFLTDQETPRETVSNFDDITQNETNTDATLDSPLPRPQSQASTSTSDHPSSYLAPTSPVVQSLPPRRVQKRTRDDNKLNNIINEVGNYITNKFTQSQPDRHDIFGQHIAFKLRNMTNEQRIYTEKLINEAIFEGELENLNPHCYIVNPGSSAINLQSAAADTSARNYAVNSGPDAMNLQPAPDTSARNYAVNSGPDAMNLQPAPDTAARNYAVNSGPDTMNLRPSTASQYFLSYMP